MENDAFSSDDFAWPTLSNRESRLRRTANASPVAQVPFCRTAVSI